jgi:hypothetical protein
MKMMVMMMMMLLSLTQNQILKIKFRLTNFLSCKYSNYTMKVRLFVGNNNERRKLKKKTLLGEYFNLNFIGTTSFSEYNL